MSKWQPIETAPKDGTNIDLWMVRREYGTTETFDGCRIANCWWGKRYYGDSDEERSDEWVNRTATWIEPVLFGEAYLITHWMPLPEPPETDQ